MTTATEPDRASPGDERPTSVARWGRTLAAALSLFVAVQLFGKFSLLSGVKVVDEAVFEFLVTGLQAIPGLTSVSERLTDIGAVSVNYGMAMALAFFVGLQRRSVLLPSLIAVTFLCGHALQYLTNRIVAGTVPTEHVIGAAGSYFSGGVMRVVLLAGMAATLALPRHRDALVWKLAIVLGLVEAITRLALGRHWPIDLFASFPIGLGIVWIFRQLALPLLERDRTQAIRSDGD